MDHSVLASDEMKYNRSTPTSQLDKFKNGILTAKKRLMTPHQQQQANGHEGHSNDIPNANPEAAAASIPTTTLMTPSADEDDDLTDHPANGTNGANGAQNGHSER